MNRVLHLRLYVAGDGPNSLAAIANLKAILATSTGRPAKLEIVDVLERPRQGLRDGVLVTPMLVKVAPGPERRILGNLHDAALVRSVLGLTEAPGG